MKITEVRVHVLEAALSEPFRWSILEAASRQSAIVEIETDGGLVGWGECLGPARPNAALVEAYRPLLIGADPLATEVLWERLYHAFRDQGQRGFAVIALSGIDIALWDLKGKHFGVPVHTLLGGAFRREVRAYATGTYRTASADPMTAIPAEAAAYVAQGFGAVKLKVGFDVAGDAALTHAVRAAIGPEAGLMLDANHGFDVVDAIAFGRRVEDCDIGWFEEPVLPEDLAGYVAVKAALTMPIAGGETAFTRHDFREILRRRAMDIIQPDACAAGGLSECKKIADMAAAFGVRCVPHVWGTGIGLAAALQLIAVLPPLPMSRTPTEPLLEFDRSEHPFRQAVLTEPIEHEHGIVRIPDGPGLGIEIDRAALDRFRAD